ncbi:MAG: thioredoxin fold domain-containing protein [bacterium]|nr:thioredoxin fold domain-containing protein [bacterium]
MKRSWIFLALLFWANPALAVEHSFPPLTDLKADLKAASNRNQAVVLVFVADDCPFCVALEEQILGPMRASGEYAPQAVVRMVAFDRPATRAKGAEGQNILYKDLVDQYKISVTPTVVFLDPQGKTSPEPLIGFNGADFYWGDLDQRIAAARGL